MDEQLKPAECIDAPKPTLRTVMWSCGLAIGPPRWFGTECYECPECPGAGEIVASEDEFEIKDGELVHAPTAWCTLCHQLLEEPYHFRLISEDERLAELRKAAGQP